MKIHALGAEFHADRQTDGRKDRHDEANSRSSQFCRPANNIDPVTLSLKFYAPERNI